MVQLSHPCALGYIWKIRTVNNIYLTRVFGALNEIIMCKAFRTTYDKHCICYSIFLSSISPPLGNPMEKEVATHAGTLALRIPWTEEHGGLQSMGSPRVGHD